MKIKRKLKCASFVCCAQLILLVFCVSAQGTEIQAAQELPAETETGQIQAAQEPPAETETGQTQTVQESQADSEAEAGNAPAEISGLTYSGSMELLYAENFSVDYYEGGYALITIKDGGRYLVVPEDGEVPKELPEDTAVLQKPLDHIYLVATSVMDFFAALDGTDQIRLSGTEEEGWYVQEAKDAMKAGDMLYAGKYSAPDYELIVSEGCDLAIESTMIYHTPEVKEKLEEFGIPVLVERSSYEPHPLGRTEWMKLYSVLLGREEEAEKLFADQTARLDKVLTGDELGKTAAFFYISSNGYVNVRKTNDYVSQMIDLAGGTYIFQDLGDSDNALSTVNMQMEEFYAGAKDADVIIYNSTIDGEIADLQELLEKSALLADFKAVKEGKVWCTTQNLFQKTTGLADMIMDIHTILTEEDPAPEELTYLYPLK